MGHAYVGAMRNERRSKEQGARNKTQLAPRATGGWIPGQGPHSPSIQPPMSPTKLGIGQKQAASQATLRYATLRHAKQKSSAGGSANAPSQDEAGRLRLGGRTVWSLFWNPGAIGPPVRARALCGRPLEPAPSLPSHVMLQNPADTSGHRGLDSRTGTTQSFHPAPYVPDEARNRAKTSSKPRHPTPPYATPRHAKPSKKAALAAAPTLQAQTRRDDCAWVEELCWSLFWNPGAIGPPVRARTPHCFD
ncbi:hypothetical protein CCAE64S_00797 [Castellaniella caeni]